MTARPLGSVLVVAIVIALRSVAHAQDIPTQRGDNERSGVNLGESKLTLPSLGGCVRRR